MSAHAANITWTGNAGDNDWNNTANWNPQAVPGEADTVIFNGAATIALTNDITVTNLHIFSQTNIVTLDFSAAPNHSLTIKTRFRLGNSNNTPTGHLVLVNAEVKTKEFDTNDNGTNSLKLNNTKLTLTGNSATDRGKLLKNGTGTTTIDADAPATGEFIVTDTVDIPDNYNGTPFAGVTLFFGSGVTVSSPTTIWTGRTGSEWDNNGNWLFGIPSDDSAVVIPDVTPAPELSSASAELSSISIDTNAKFTISSGGTLSAGKITNHGTITIKGGITGTTSTSAPDFINSDASSIIYDGASAPVWGNIYNNLEIKSGSLTFTNNTSVNGLLKISSAIINNAILTAKGNVTSTADISGTGTMLFTGTNNQTFSAASKTYTNIEENKTNGTLTISGSCNIGNFTITKSKTTIIEDNPEITTLTITDGGTTSFSGNPEITNLTITKSDSLTFANNPVIGSLTITRSNNITFTGTPQIASLTDTSNAGNITFNAGANITSNVSLSTSGLITLSGNLTAADFSAGKVTIDGTGSITAGVISIPQLNAAGSDAELSITASSFTLPLIGSSTTAFNSLELSPASASLTFENSYVYSAKTKFSAGTNDISISNIKASGELDFDTTGILSLASGSGSLSADKISFTSSPSQMKLSGSFSFVQGFVIPAAHPQLQLLADTTITSTGTNAPVTLYDNISGSGYNLTITNSGLFTLNDITSTTDPAAATSDATSYIDIKSFTQNGSGTNILSGDITAEDTILFGKSIELAGNCALKTSAASGNLVTLAAGSTLSSDPAGNSLFVQSPLVTNGALTANANLYVTGNLTSGGNIDGSEKVIFTGAADQFFSAGTYTYSKLEEDKSAGSLTINGSCKPASFEITNGVTTTFTNNPEITNLTITDSDTTIFSANPVITNLDIINSDTILFSANPKITNFTIADSNTITFSGTPEITHLTDSNNAGDINFNNGGTITDDVEFTTDGTVSIKGTLITAAITLGNTSGGPMTIKNSGLLTLSDGKSLSFTDSFIQNGAGNASLGGSFTGSASTPGASVTASFANDLLLSGSSAASFGAAGNTITANENLVIARSAPLSDALTIDADSVKADNLVFYKGAVNAKGNLTSVNDIVIFGTGYNTTDPSTGIAGEYAYTAPRKAGLNWSQPQYSATNLPDGTSLPASGFNSTLSIDSGIALHVGKNFYANGANLTRLSGTTDWYIDILSNVNPVNCFAEVYNCNISNCTVRCHTGPETAANASSDDAQIVAEGGSLSGCTNFDSTSFEITEAYTVRDNAIFVKFNRPIRYYDNMVSHLLYNDGADGFTFEGFYKNPDCQNAYKITSDIMESQFYIKANPKDGSTFGAWNTDATGKSVGEGKSSDRNGIHHSTKPSLDFPRALTNSGGTLTEAFILTDRFGKRLTHYSGTSYRFTSVLDKTGPVLVQVRTGQETHTTNLTTQQAYDAHNFIEFIYSEAVNFGPTANAADPAKMNTAAWIPAYTSGVSGTENQPQNIPVSIDLGFVNNFSGLTFTGLNQTIASGTIHTKQAGSDSQNVNALYRQSTHSIKYSLAGYASNVSTNGTITGSYINWQGYIEEAVLPSGSVSASEAFPNNNITDCALAADGTTPLYNSQIMNKTGLSVNSSEESGTNYGGWDTFAPVFVRGHIKGDPAEASYFEAIGNGNGSTLTKIEIHIADNPSSATSPNGIWLTRYGWADSAGAAANLLSAAADDLTGGSRPFASSTSNQTKGALRHCTIQGQQNAFSYEIGEGAASTPRHFTTIDSGASAPFFASSTSNRNEIPTEDDNTYINLALSDTNLPYKSTFTVSYDESGSYITDLAGNRLRSQFLMNTIDRTSPDFKISFSPVNSNKLLLIFVKELSTQIKYNDGVISPEDIPSFETIIPYCFEIGTISGTTFNANSGAGNLQIDTSVPARILRSKSNSHYTLFELTLNQNTTLEDIKNLYIRLKNAGTVGGYTYAATSTDPLTGIGGSYVTFIQDTIGNYMQMYQAHALSDFAAGIVNPLYAYNDNLEYDEENISYNLYEQGSWAVHDWNAEQNNYGSLLANKAVTLISSVDENQLTVDSNGDPEFQLKLYYSASPTSGSQSSNFNSDIPANPLRLWMPDISGFKDNGLFPAYASTTNSNYGTLTGSLVTEHDISSGFSFNFTETDVQNFNPGKQISFLFGLFDAAGNQEALCINPLLSFSGGSASYNTSDKVPLLCIRLKNSSDITSLDLWSFKTKNIKSQRGGVTILNNVIDPGKGEKAIVKVNLEEEGRLNVMVMTLDGNIITYLNRGKAKAGELYFTWNGKNQNGNSVARGMYFVRVTGSGIDETRKVMVVRD